MSSIAFKVVKIYCCQDSNCCFLNWNRTVLYVDTNLSQACSSEISVFIYTMLQPRSW